MYYDELLKLRIKWQAEIKRLQTDRDYSFFGELSTETQKTAIKYLDFYKDGQITTYMQAIDELDNICGCELDMLENKYKQNAKDYNMDYEDYIKEHLKWAD